MRGDYATRNANIEAKKMLCDRCGGTGNEFFTMYRKCQDCNGTGAVDNGVGYMGTSGTEMSDHDY